MGLGDDISPQALQKGFDERVDIPYVLGFRNEAPHDLAREEQYAAAGQSKLGVDLLSNCGQVFLAKSRVQK